MQDTCQKPACASSSLTEISDHSHIPYGEHYQTCVHEPQILA